MKIAKAEINGTRLEGDLSKALIVLGSYPEPVKSVSIWFKENSSHIACHISTYPKLIRLYSNQLLPAQFNVYKKFIRVCEFRAKKDWGL